MLNTGLPAYYLNMLKAPEFVKWVKIRIGEPLTALDMNERKV